MMHRYRLAAIFLSLFIVFSCSRSQSPIEGSLPDSYTVTTDVSPEGAGEVSPSGGEFLDGTRIEFRANPSADFVFEGWSGDLTGSANPTFLTIRRNLNVTANFTPRDYDLTIEIVGEGVVTEEVIDRVIESQSSGDLSASSQTADSSRDSGDQKSDDQQDIDRSSGDLPEDGIDARSQRPEGGEISVNQVTTSSNVVSTTVELTAEPAEGWFFARWEGDLEGDENPQQTIIDEPKSVTAVFEEIPELQLVVNIEGEGTVDIDPDEESYGDGDEVTLTATAADEWEFRRWQGDENSEENPLIITMDSDKEITAVFGRTGAPEQEITQQPEDGTAGVPLEPAPAVQLLTPDGDPLEGVTITASLNKSEFSSESTTDVETDAEGVAEFTNLRINSADSDYRINFSADADDVSSVESSTFDIEAADGVPANSSAEVPDGVVGESTVITITVNDPFGNPVSGAASDLSVTVSGANSASPDVEAGSEPGTYSAEYTPVSIGEDQIAIELNGEAISGSPFSSEITASDISSTNSSVAVDPDLVQAGNSSVVTITLRDEENNPVAGMEDDIELGDINPAVADDIEETDEPGVYRTEITSAEVGEITVVVVADGVTLEDQPVITFVSGPADQIEIVSGNNQSAQVASELSDPIVVRVTDAFGNPVEGVEVEFEFTETPTAAAGQSFGDSTVETDEDGLAGTTVTLGTTPGTYEITADAGVDETVTFTASAQIGSVSDLLISQQPQTGTAGEALDSAPSVSVVDELGNAIEGVSVSASLNGGDLTDGSETSATSDEDGLAEFDDLVIETAGSGYTLEFTVGSNALSIESNEFEVEPAEPLAGNTTATVPNGSAGDLTSITITVEDAFGNRVEGAADRLELSISGDNSSVSPESIEDDGNGVYQTSYRPVTTGEDEITITLDGNSIQGSPFSSSVATSDADAVSVETQPSETVAGQPIEGPPSARVDDEFGNPVEGVEVTVTIVGGGSFNSGTTTAESNSSGIAVFDDLVINSSGSYSLRFNAVGADDDAESDSFDVVPAPPSASATTADVPDGASGEETVIEITVRDSFGNRVSGVASDLSVSVSGANSASPSVSETSTAGLYRAEYTPASSGTDNIAIELGGSGISGSPFTSEVGAGDVASFSIENISNVTAGESFTISVTAEDGNGNTATGFDGSADVSVNSGSISPTSLSFNNGEASGSFTIEEAGNNRVVTITSNSVSDDSNSFNVSPGPVDNVTAVSGSSQSNTVGSTLSDPFVVEVTDAFGNTISDVSVSFSVSSSPSGASGQSVSPTSADTDGNGRASTTLTLGDRPGEYVVTAEANGESATISADAETGSPSNLAINPQPSDVTAGASFSPAPAVRVSDAEGNPVESVDVDVALSGGSFSAGTTTQSTNSSGVATFGNLQINSEGSYQLEFSAGSLDVTSNSFNVSPGQVDNVTAVSGSGQSDTVGSTLSDPFVVEVTDAFGNTISGVNVSFEVTNLPSGASGQSVSPTSADTDGSGRASTTLTLGDRTGEYEVTAEANGESATISADAETGSPSNLAINPQPTDVIAGESISPAPAVTVTDEGGNPIEDVNVDVALLGGTFSSGTTTQSTNSSGVATFGNLQINSAGSYQLEFSAGSLDETSQSFTVSATSPSPSNTTADVPDGQAGEETEILIDVVDAFGNAITGVASDLSVSVSGANTASPDVTETSTDGQYRAAYTPSNSGTDNITIELNGEGISGSPFESEVSAGDPEEINITVQPSNTVAGEELSPTPEAEVTDEEGNTLEGLEVEISLIGGSFSSGITTRTTGVDGRAQFPGLEIEAAGTYRIQFEVNGLTSEESDEFTIEPAAATSIAIQSGNNQSGPILEELGDPLSVLVTDNFGNPVEGESVSFQLPEQPEDANGSVLSSTSVSTDPQGLAEINFTPGDKVGEYIVEASIGDDDVRFTVTATAGAPENLAVLEQPTETVAGEEITPAPALEVTDIGDNPVEGVSVEVSLNDGSFATTPGSVNTGSDGVASFSGLIIEDIGSYTIDFIVDGLDTETTDPFEVIAAAPDAELSLVEVNPEEQTIGQNVVLTIIVRDAFGNVISGVNVDDFVINFSGDGEVVESVVEDGAEPGRYTAEITSPSAGEVSISVTVLGVDLDESTVVTFSSEP
ncbi:MAG: Ig-like domain-containing protein [Balneolaceae bacterium]|nr:Ig-like domain-containing protein [Balneolaceae bacterium]